LTEDNAWFQDVAADRHDEVKKYFIHLAENVTHMLSNGMSYVLLK
jgi:CBS domain-containing protein